MPDLNPMRVEGRGEVSGGRDPDPPIHGWTLLAWQPGHPQFGDDVFLEDGTASVPEILEAMRGQSPIQVARVYCTTPAHVHQALGYAALAKGG